MKNRWVLIAILVLAAVLRLYGLTKYPEGLNADEAALGYNAYSLLLTGRDEHGHPWPVNLESFADFKPALYSYLLIPLFKILGPTDLAVRLPSAIAGIVAVFVVYLLMKDLYHPLDPPLKLRGGDRQEGVILGLLSAFMLAISPWHLKFSRGGWETNLATTLLVLGAWLLVKWLKSGKFLSLAFCVLIFALPMYTYQSARLVAPLLAGGWLLLNWREIWPRRRLLILAGALAAVLLAPLLWSVVTTPVGSRLTGVGLLADEGPVNRANELRGQHPNWNSFSSRLLHNRLVLYTTAFLKNYTDHFGGDFLFVNGDAIERYKIPETGPLYLTDIVLVVLGVIFLLRTKNYQLSTVVWWWLLIAPVASALTFQTPSALRSENMVIPITILISAGLLAIKDYPFVAKRIILFIFLVVYGWQVSRYLHQYYVHYPQAYPMAWDYGFNELASYVKSVQNNYDQILVTDKYDQPYILFLWYLKYPPKQFQFSHQLTPRDKFNFSTVREFDKYRFGSTNWEQVRDIHSALIVAAPEDIPEVGVNVIKTIYFPGGNPAFKIVSN